MADVEAIDPEGDAPVTEEPTAPQVVRRSSIGDMVKDLENAYEEAQVQVALLSEQVKEKSQQVLALTEASELSVKLIHAQHADNAIGTLRYEKVHAQIKALCKETLDEDAPDHPSIHVMNEMNERTASAEEQVMALEQRLHAVNKLNNINRGQIGMKCLGDAVISVFPNIAVLRWQRNAQISRALDLVQMYI